MKLLTKILGEGSMISFGNYSYLFESSCSVVIWLQFLREVGAISIES